MFAPLREVSRRVRLRLNPTGQRGAVLRQCDWRFLLPTPPGGMFEHMVLLGAPEGLAEAIVRAEIACRVSEQVPRDRCADALIILHRSNATVTSCAGCLRPEGVVYWEIDRRRLLRCLASVGWGFRALRSAGLSPTSAYWVRPGFTNAQVYLPLGDDSVLWWYLRNLYTATTLRGRSLEFLLYVLSALGARVREGLIPVFALTAAYSTEKKAPSIMGHSDLGRDLWRSVRRPRGSGRLSDLELLLLTGGGDDWNRVVAMPFPPGGPNPLAVLKLSRVPDRNVHTEKEQKVLCEIRAAVDADMRRTLPEGFGTFSWRGLTVGMESYVSGRLLAATSARWGNSLSRKVDDLNLAVQWLIEFHRQTEIRRAEWGNAELATWSSKALDRYETVFGLTPGEQNLFEKARQRYQELAGSSFPIVWYHYAFSAWNICRQNNDIGVFDWESAERGPALFDLIYLVFRWNQELGRLRGRSSHLRAFRELFLTAPNGHPASRAIQKAIQRYMAALEIDQRSFPLVLVALWTLHAITRADRARNLAQAGPDVRRGNVYVSYLGVLAEEADRLFQAW
jgi:hypothetical protein